MWCRAVQVEVHISEKKTVSIFSVEEQSSPGCLRLAGLIGLLFGPEDGGRITEPLLDYTESHATR
jgi:hypothetical protein